MRLVTRLLGLLLLASACASPESGGPGSPPSADLVLLDGRIATVDPELGEVEALAARDGRIVAVGTSQEIAAYVGADTQIVDLEGRRAIPGFIEGHAHLANMGHAIQILPLREASSWDEVIAMVEAAVAEAEPGEWILGRGWHQEKWDRVPADAVEGFPAHTALSAISPDNPVSLRHASGHAGFYNAKAMELAGVNRATRDPEGGELMRLPDGSPSGVFVETAMGLVERVHAEQQAELSDEERAADIRRALALADRECLENGITSFQDAGSSFEVVDVMRDMASKGEFGTRQWVMIRDTNEALRERLQDYKIVDGYDHHLTVNALKRTLDGALGSRGAWLHAPYTDEPTTSGLNTKPVAYVEETARIAAEAGFQMCVHAIGDRANTETLDLFERQLDQLPDGRERRWRVEHAQHLVLADIPRFAELGVIASMQGVHCTSDAPFVEPRLGERRAEEGAYVWRKLIEAGAVVTNGTDAPVEDIDPLASYHASVTRLQASGAPFYPDQRMTREEALASYTINCAYSAFEEDLKGSLTPGKLADITVLSRDILEVPDDELLEAEVLLTIVGGEVLYAAESWE